MTKKNTKHTSGRFCWHELSVGDVAAARAFYGELLGWTFSEMDMGPGGVYTIAKSGTKDVGGLTKSQPGQPAGWLAYATTPDADNVAKRIEKLGGKVVVPPTDIPGVGRFTVLADSQGATLGALTSLEEKLDPSETAEAPIAGRFCWDELHTQDAGKAFGQYAELFNYGVKEMDMGAHGTYRVLTRDGNDAGGITTAQPGKPNMWLSYVAVENVDAATKRAESLKAKTLVPPMDIPNIGRFSILADPQGAVIALYKSASAT